MYFSYDQYFMGCLFIPFLMLIVLGCMLIVVNRVLLKLLQQNKLTVKKRIGVILIAMSALCIGVFCVGQLFHGGIRLIGEEETNAEQTKGYITEIEELHAFSLPRINSVYCRNLGLGDPTGYRITIAGEQYIVPGMPNLEVGDYVIVRYLPRSRYTIYIVGILKEDELAKEYFERLGADDSVLLEEALTTEYDVEELNSFFDKRQGNVNTGFAGNTGSLKYGEVNERFPIEIMRTKGYTVYRVRQGGYFYVFWSCTYDMEAKEPVEPDVYFAAHLASNRSVEAFEFLEPGVSTAQDVKEIDPYVELNFLLSSGIRSYSLLNQEEIMEIRYTHSEGAFDNYDDLVVESAIIIPREASLGRLGNIMCEDIPQKMK